jgi:S1-C subfamily serine protease
MDDSVTPTPAPSPTPEPTTPATPPVGAPATDAEAWAATAPVAAWVPTRTAAGDPWTSPLWGDPGTVGGYWPDPSVAAFPAYAEVPAAPRRSRTPALVTALALFLAAVLAGVGVSKVVTRGDSPVAAGPSPSASSAPANPTPSPSSTNPGSASTPGSAPSTAPDPGTGQGLPGQGLPGQAQPPQGSQSGASTKINTTAVTKALVNITSTIGYDGGEAAGTGIVLTSDGYVLTNHHVVAGSTALTAEIAGTTTSYPATVVGYDASHDIAVIKLEGASGLDVAPIGSSASVGVGDEVAGLGNAGGLGGRPIVAGGSVTGLDKAITALDSASGVSERLSGLIETDANIKPGDSGGALVDKDGKVVGVITAGSTSGGRISSTTTDGYAVPIDQAMSIASDIRAGKASSTIHIGASAFLGITVTASATHGVPVRTVVPGQAADKAGLASGDVITEIDGVTVTDNASLRAVITKHQPGDTVSIRWTDTNGSSHRANVTFGSGPVG